MNGKAFSRANRRWIVVREVSLSRAETPGEVQVHMQLATYFADEDKIPPPTAPVSPARRTVRTVERRVAE